MKRISVLMLLAALPAQAQEAAPAPKPRIAVVIDDFGLTYPKNVPDEKWWAIPWPYTAAVMPESPRTKVAAAAAKDAGKEVIIHFPFDPFLSLELSTTTATASDVDKVTKLLNKAVPMMPAAVGLNNHRSYKATQNAYLMRAFMPLVKERGFYFLDSKVSPKSAAYAEAKAAGLRSAVNDVFLDEATRHDKDFCLKMLGRAAAIAKKKGYVVTIGHHYFWGTYECLIEKVPQLQAEGFDFVFASELAR